MASSSLLKLSCAAFLCMVVVAPHAEAAITCGAVAKGIAPCLAYLKSGGAPPPPCCAGVRSLVSMATTPADRRTACGCLKTSAASIPGLNYGFASALPGKCGVSVPYPISPNTDCSKYDRFLPPFCP